MIRYSIPMKCTKWKGRKWSTVSKKRKIWRDDSILFYWFWNINKMSQRYREVTDSFSVIYLALIFHSRSNKFSCFIFYWWSQNNEDKYYSQCILCKIMRKPWESFSITTNIGVEWKSCLLSSINCWCCIIENYWIFGSSFLSIPKWNITAEISSTRNKPSIERSFTEKPRSRSTCSQMAWGTPFFHVYFLFPFCSVFHNRSL